MMKVLSLVNQTKDQCANLRRSANLLLHENKIAYFTRDYSYYTIDNYPPLRAEHYYYKQISLKEGLPSNVRCILRDEQGFIWIGTKAGLGKFDGHQLKRYKHQANDPHSLLHNLIYQIAEDKQHNIWILTEKGIARYQQQSNNFTFLQTKKGITLLPIPSASFRMESCSVAKTESISTAIRTLR